MQPIINLASEEYSKAITPYLKPKQEFISVVFGSIVDGKLKVKATLAKMARGEMVRFMAENNVDNIEDLKKFNHPDWKLSTNLSTPKQLVFIYQK